MKSTSVQRAIQITRKSAHCYSALQVFFGIAVNSLTRKKNPILLLLLSIWLTFPLGLDAQNREPMGRLEGAVFVADQQGRSYVAGAKVVLSGPTTLQTETDQQGKFSISDVPIGIYTVDAVLPGLEPVQAVMVSVEAGVPTEAEVAMKAATVQTAVTVTATEEETKDSSPTQTISATTLTDAPNHNERVESLLPLIPGVVRGADGRINMKGARDTQSGALVNSANVTDPVTGSPAMNLPVDVVGSVQVISNPYDPQYGKFTGAVSTIDTKTGNYDKFHFSIQNIAPRLRDRDGIKGIGAATPRTTISGPLVKDKVAITQSIEYRFIRTPVNSLPALERDTKLESFDSYTQLDFILTPKQTATVSVSVYPQKLNYLGLNTFTTQLSTPDFHQRGYQSYAQHRYIIGNAGLLTSQFGYKRFDADITARSDDPYRLLTDTTEGGFFNRQRRRSYRVSWQEDYSFAPWQFAGSHQFTVGLGYEHSQYNGGQKFLPVEIDGASNQAVERVSFTSPKSFSVDQNELSWFAGDKWAITPRFSLSLGGRFDRDSVTSATHAAPRAGFLLALTKDSRTVLKGGTGLFYDRVPLMIPIFPELPGRTVTMLGQDGAAISSISYQNEITRQLRNPRSTSWNLELDREVSKGLLLRVAYEHRVTAKDFVVSPVSTGSTGVLGLSNSGGDTYRELQFTARYQLHRHLLNASYVRSRAYGNLNDYNQFFGNLAQPIIQPDAVGRLPFDAPNRFLFWGTFAAPWKLTLSPVYDVHTGFPYSIENQYRQYVGPRNTDRFRRFSSFDLQILRPISLPFGKDHLQARVGMGVFNLFNHDNPRDVQNNLASARFGEFFNPAWREFRGKFVLGF